MNIKMAMLKITTLMKAYKFWAVAFGPLVLGGVVLGAVGYKNLVVGTGNEVRVHNEGTLGQASSTEKDDGEMEGTSTESSSPSPNETPSSSSQKLATPKPTAQPSQDDGDISSDGASSRDEQSVSQPAPTQVQFQTPPPSVQPNTNGTQSLLEYEINQIILEERQACLDERNTATADLRAQLQQKYDEYNSVRKNETLATRGRDISAPQLERRISIKKSEVYDEITNFQFEIAKVEAGFFCY